MPLTDIAVRNAKSATRPRKFYDQEGLYLLVHPQGGKWWRLRYRFDGKEKGLSLGTYPETGLKEARARRDKSRTQLAQGIDPSQARKAEKVAKADTFEAIAREWFAKHLSRWAASHSNKIIGRLERDVFPWVGGRPIADITASEILACLRRIEARGAVETAHRAHQNFGQVLRYAVASGHAQRDPSADLRGALSSVKGGHFAAITDPPSVGALLRTVEGYQGSFVTKSALRLAPLVFVRPGELRKAEWSEFNLDAAEWRYTVSKTDTAHIVPLATQAVEILRELHPLTGSGRYVFPSLRTHTRPMSENTLNAALRRLGYNKDEMCVHGFRATARTLLDEVLGFSPHLIEHQLAHVVRDPLGRAYNRTQHLPERRKMMAAWSDYLDGLKNGADVIAFRTP